MATVLRAKPGTARRAHGRPTPEVGPHDPVGSAREAGLRYTNDRSPGIRRRRRGQGFVYVGPDGRTVRDRETLQRITSLVIPPAWEDVWISPIPTAISRPPDAMRKVGNTPTVCRKCYVHPEIINSYLDGSMLDTLRQVAEQEMAETLHDLRPEEAAVLALLRRRLASDADP